MKTLIAPLVLAALSALASAAPSPCSGTSSSRGLLQTQKNVFSALSDGVVLDSRLRAGDIVPAGRPVLKLSSTDSENRLNEVRARLTELNLKLLEVRNTRLLNEATLKGYESQHGPMSVAMKKRVLREDESALLEQTIQELKRNERSLASLRDGGNGSFPYPVLLLADPPRVSETIKEGSPLFSYAQLDRIKVSLYGQAASGDTPARIFVPLGPHCLRLDYLRAEVEPHSNKVEYIYQGTVARELAPRMAEAVRAPRPYISVYH